MLKTLKRKIALVAVAALGAGGLTIAIAPAANAALAVATETTFVQTGTTTAVKANAGALNAAAEAGSDDIAMRAGINTLKVGMTGMTTADVAFFSMTSGAAAPTTVSQVVDLGCTSVAGDEALSETAGDMDVDGAGALVATTDTGCRVTVTGTAIVDLIFTTPSLAAGAYSIWASETTSLAATTYKIADVTVVGAGAPASVSWAQNTREINPAAQDYATTITVKDASGVATVLVGAETVVFDIAPQTGVATTQVELGDYSISADEITATTGTSYAVTMDGDGSGAGGPTIAGTTYSLGAQIVIGGAAIGAPSISTYTRVNNTSGLTGTISFFSDAAATTALTSITATPAVATANFYAQLKDSAGAVVVGATLTASLTTLTDAALVTSAVTGVAGITTARNFTPAAGGSGSYNLSVSTGTGSISASLPATATAYGVTDALAAGITVAATNGNGFKTVTAGTAYDASLTTTGFSVVISGVDAGKTVKLETTGSTATTPKVAGVATPGYAVADATGKVTTTASVASATNGQTLVIVVDADGDGGGDNVTVTITFRTAVGALTTTPATATTSFVAVSSSQTINAVVADQFSNPLTGGNVTIVNNTVPAGVTAMTTAVKNVDAAGKADLTATIGATAGTYQFTITARDANGNTIGTASVVTFTATTDGAPGSVTLTAGGSEAGLGTYRTWVSTNGVVAASAGNGLNNPAGTLTQVANATADAISTTDTATQALAKVGDYVVLTVSVKNATGTGVDNVKVGVKGSAGVYIANSTTGAPTSGTTKLSAMVDTDGTTTGGGVATFYAVATKVGTNTVTFTVGSKTATATFTAETGLNIQSIARDVKLSSSTIAVKGNEITQVTATVTDAWGNPVSGVALTGTVTGAAGRFAGGGRTFSASTDAAGTLVFELTANATEKGAGTLTVAGVDAAANITNADFRTGDLSVNVATLGKDNVNSVTATLAVTEGTVAASPEIATVKADVKAVSDTVATLSKAVTTIQSSVTELTSSFSAQIKSLSAAIAKISKAIAALSKKIK